MVDDDDCKDQKEITDISWRSLIVSADKERTADRLDPNISYVVVTKIDRVSRPDPFRDTNY